MLICLLIIIVGWVVLLARKLNLPVEFGAQYADQGLKFLRTILAASEVTFHRWQQIMQIRTLRDLLCKTVKIHTTCFTVHLLITMRQNHRFDEFS
jgi:hypothetical protein